MRSFRIEYENIYKPLFEILKNEFEKNEELNINTIKTIKSILIAESLILHENGRFYFDYLKEAINTDSITAMDFDKFNKVITFVPSNDILKTNLFIESIRQSKSLENKTPDIIVENKFKPFLFKVPINLFLLYFGKKVIQRHTIYCRFLEDFEKSKVSQAYDYLRFKNLSCKEFYRPIDKNSKNYHILLHVLVEIHIYNNVEFICKQKKYEDDLNNFSFYLERLFDESINYNNFKDGFKKILNDVNIKFNEDYYSKEIELFLKTNIDYLLKYYSEVFLDCMQLRKKKNFLSKISCKINKLYQLELLGFKNITNMKKELEIIINDNILKISNNPRKNV